MGLFGKSKKEKVKEAEYMERINVPQCLKQDFILQNGTAIETVITGIDLRTKERKPNQAAYATEQVGIALRGISKEQVQPGAVLAIKNGGKYEMQN